MAAQKFLDDNGLVYLWSKIKAKITASLPTKTSELTNDSGFITSSDIPEGAAASTTTPKMDGTAEVGTERAFARGDHRHPSDTAKQDVISDLATIRSGAQAGATAYQKPSGGIPSSDMATAVQTALNSAGTAYQKPANGIPATDLASAVQTSLGLADSALQPGDITGISFEVVTALPATGTAGVIYLKAIGGASAPDAYEEYIWLASKSAFEKIGDTNIDLSGYMLKTDITTISNSEIDTITAA